MTTRTARPPRIAELGARSRQEPTAGSRGPSRQRRRVEALPGATARNAPPRGLDLLLARPPPLRLRRPPQPHGVPETPEFLLQNPLWVPPGNLSSYKPQDSDAAISTKLNLFVSGVTTWPLAESGVRGVKALPIPPELSSVEPPKVRGRFWAG